MRELHPTLTGSDKEDAEHYFPELKESEDERIRKELIFFFESEIPQCSIPEHAEKMKQFIAYLERQKEPLTAEEKMNHPLYLEGFDVGKKVGEVVSEQKSTEWSEKEKKMLAVISYKISQHQGNDERSLFTPDEAEFICEMEDKLKSFRPQTYWKPSEEQMKALYEVRTIFHHHHLWDEINPILYDYEELMRDLKKLL